MWFSATSVAVINDLTRDVPAMVANHLPDLSAVKVRVVDAATGAVIPGATVQVFNIKTVHPYTVRTEPVTAAADPGEWTFPFTPYPNVSVFGNFDMLKLIKASAPGYEPAATYRSTFDAQHHRLVNGQMDWCVVVELQPE